MPIIRPGKFFLVLLLLALACPTDLRAGSNDAGHWEEYGLKWDLARGWYVKGDTQFRLRDNWQDLHYVRLEFGPGVRLGKSFDFLVMYRFNPTESGGQWTNTHYLILDPTLNLRLTPDWALDLRSRFQVRLGEQGRGFWRPRIRVTRKLTLGGHKLSWYGANEFFVQTTALGARSRFNQNRVSTGLKLGLSSTVDLDTYYLLRSDQAREGAPWTHIHVLGTSLFFKLK